MDRHVQDDYGQKYRQTCAVSLWTKVQTDLNMITMDKVQTDQYSFTVDRSIDRLVQFCYGQKYRQISTVLLWTEVQTDLHMTLDRCGHVQNDYGQKYMQGH